MNHERSSNWLEILSPSNWEPWNKKRTNFMFETVPSYVPAGSIRPLCGRIKKPLILFRVSLVWSFPRAGLQPYIVIYVPAAWEESRRNGISAWESSLRGLFFRQEIGRVLFQHECNRQRGGDCTSVGKAQVHTLSIRNFIMSKPSLKQQGHWRCLLVEGSRIRWPCSLAIRRSF